jgi:hypothetical protein
VVVSFDGILIDYEQMINLGVVKSFKILFVLQENDFAKTCIFLESFF